MFLFPWWDWGIDISDFQKKLIFWSISWFSGFPRVKPQLTGIPHNMSYNIATQDHPIRINFCPLGCSDMGWAWGLGSEPKASTGVWGLRWGLESEMGSGVWSGVWGLRWRLVSPSRGLRSAISKLSPLFSLSNKFAQVIYRIIWVSNKVFHMRQVPYQGSGV